MLDNPRLAADEVFHILRTAGNREYLREGVTQLEHALQTANLAIRSGATYELVVAALLHDIGHLCAPKDADSMAGAGVVDHEFVGADFLQERGFSELVTEVIYGHVPAKRYLVSKSQEYAQRLSPSSIKTLRFQGGPMSESEARGFETQPFFREKIQLRMWDDRAKCPGITVPPLESYYDLIVEHLTQGFRPD
jgi:phosphonate degradation associated HDIG domain protein